MRVHWSAARRMRRVQQMRKWCDPLQGAAPVMGPARPVLIVLLFAAFACGPRVVPYPDRPARGTHNAGTAGGQPAGSLSYAGAGVPTGAAGGVTTPAMSASVPPTSVAAQSGSLAPPVAGISGTVPVPPLPAAGRGE